MLTSRRKAPGCFPDADDTAKGIAALRILGTSASVNGLVQMFETADHFRTYPGERNPSFSANCNVLIVSYSWKTQRYTSRRSLRQSASSRPKLFMVK
jgi:hypothetical protein